LGSERVGKTNMSFLTLVHELGEDADLLTRSDDWLEQERRSAAAKLDKAANELRAVLLAQKVKRALQQKNLVAVQQILRDANGEIRDITIRLLNLPDALALLSAPVDTLDEANATGQISVWVGDGYDIPAAAALRA
jgi:hypothetical protein